MTIKKFTIKGLIGSILAFALIQGASAATEVSGVKFEDTVKVGGKDLKLNGAGMRTKFIIKVYAAGLYLPEKNRSVPEILKMDGPRRVTLVMMRELTSDEFGQAFMTGLNNNLDVSENSKYASQISKFGEMFGMIERLKKGDVLHMDWIPGTGTQAELNGKKVGEAVPDLGFYNAVLRIWLGEKPADRSLKPALLGEAR
jgi:hypothetical protein